MRCTQKKFATKGAALRAGDWTALRHNFQYIYSARWCYACEAWHMYRKQKVQPLC